MRQVCSFYQTMSAKLSLFSLSFALVLLALGQVSYAEAGSWGKTEEMITFESTTWNGVYMDLDQFSLTALIPNYSGAVLQNGLTQLKGQVEDKGYVITTTHNPGLPFERPKSLKKFIKLVQDSNPDFIVSGVNNKILGADYVVDLIPNDQTDPFWRYLVTKNRFIKMGSVDKNGQRRLKFFDSVRIK